MFSARRLVGLGILTVALIGCRGIPSSKDSALPKASPVPTPAGKLVQVGQVAYANWGHLDARDKETRPLASGDFYFKETFIQGEPGQKLTLQIKNIAEQVHNFSLPAQGLDRDIPPESARVDIAVIFPQSGGLQFFCKYHTALGMNGLLAVGGATPVSMASPSPGASPQPAR